MEPGPSVDPKVVENIVDRLKKRGLFDKFRKECLIDIDTTVSMVVIVVIDIGGKSRQFEKSKRKHPKCKDRLIDIVTEFQC